MERFGLGDLCVGDDETPAQLQARLNSLEERFPSPAELEKRLRGEELQAERFSVEFGKVMAGTADGRR